jgi:hypothetical protein
MQRAAAPLAVRTGEFGPGWRFIELTPDLKQVQLSIAKVPRGAMLEALVPKGALAAVNGGYFMGDFRPAGWVKDHLGEHARVNLRASGSGVFAVAGDQRYIVSVRPSHLERCLGAPDDGAHQFEEVGTYATQIPEARARRRVQGSSPG